MNAILTKKPKVDGFGLATATQFGLPGRPPRRDIATIRRFAQNVRNKWVKNIDPPANPISVE